MPESKRLEIPRDVHDQPLVVTLLIIGVCVGWLTNYLGMIHKSFQDESYGMPLVALSCNIAYEMVYVVYPIDAPVWPIVFILWLALNLVVCYTTLRFAPKEWAHAPLVQRNLLWIFVVSIACWMTAHLAFKAQLGPVLAAAWSAMFCQVFLSAASLWQLMVRGSSRGTSLFIWFSRFMGTAIVLPEEILRYKHKDPTVVWNNPMGWWGAAAFFVLDISYGVLLWKILRSERTVAVKSGGKGRLESNKAE
ncbi:hypothetical protein IFM61392_02637 [Aspergillus lentulus]|uniref:Uncharacterized protein n=1 Tax=Aspergillus lentulus TaxID=293939 RepID=A0ABQ1A2W2_ASPLE|nr:hypothetical protein IFM60648_03631 [Aspergillus lentulus]GFF75013.1 hypothetical protein IFM62136_08965 [Aspergillus lentulus]GFF93546.1 hypothetical protein IFM47457_09573 [Aspergillus lentulus]GFG03111.1 hypothetical protein IFM61392_02637 [Aspergillus lentulus]